MRLCNFLYFAAILFFCACLASYENMPVNQKDGKYSAELFMDNHSDPMVLSVFIRWPYSVELLEDTRFFYKNLSTGEYKRYTKKDKEYSTFNGYNVINLISQRAVKFDSSRITPKIILSAKLKDFPASIDYNNVRASEIKDHHNDFFLAGDTTIANIKYTIFRGTTKRLLNNITYVKSTILLDKRYKDLPVNISKMLGEKFNGWVFYYETWIRNKAGAMAYAKVKLNYTPLVSKSEDSILNKYIALAKDSLR